MRIIKETVKQMSPYIFKNYEHTPSYHLKKRHQVYIKMSSLNFIKDRSFRTVLKEIERKI